MMQQKCCLSRDKNHSNKEKMLAVRGRWSVLKEREKHKKPRIYSSLTGPVKLYIYNTSQKDCLISLTFYSVMHLALCKYTASTLCIATGFQLHWHFKTSRNFVQRTQIDPKSDANTCSRKLKTHFSTVFGKHWCLCNKCRAEHSQIFGLLTQLTTGFIHLQ